MRTPADNEIYSSRTLNAPLELVYQAFANPHHLKNWWGPEGFRAEVQELDAREGGALRYEMIFTDTDAVAMDDIDFRYPVEVGDLVTLDASVHFVGNTSMVIGIEVRAENTVKGQVRHTNTSYVTMVAQDENGVSRQVPPLLLETEADIRNFHAAIARREASESLRSKLDAIKTDVDLEFVLQKLTPYRCVIQKAEVLHQPSSR